jgi:hypothetical protein
VVGEPLTLNIFAAYWNPVPTYFAYQWLRNGAEIHGATSSSYEPTAADVGARISARVTGSLDTYDPVSVVSSPTAPVKRNFTSIPTPTILGTAAIGKTLTVHTTAWSPAASSYTVVWYADGEYVGSGSTFVPGRAEHIGKRITVVVSGSSSAAGPVASPPSAPTAPVAPGTLPAGKIAFSSPVRMNTTASATSSGWPDPSEVTYQWYLGGKAVPGATELAYAVPNGVRGQTLRAVATLAEPGLGTVSASTKTVVIESGSINPGRASINGPVRVGAKLTANLPQWSPSNVTMSVRWRLGANWLDFPKSVGTSKTFTVPAKDYGRHIYIVATGTLSHYDSAIAHSGYYAIGKGLFSRTPKPTITGTTRVGSKLTAHHGTWSPSSGVSYSYRWYVQASPASAPVAISHATKSTYRVPAAYVGKTLTVRITAKKKVYSNATVTSAQTAAIRR